MPHLSRAALIALVLAAGFLALFPLWGDTFYIRFVTKIMVYALFAMSLDLLVGYAGLVSLGHAAFFGIAVYAVAGVVNKAGVTSAFVLLPAALGVSAAAAAAIGWLSIRTSGVYFIMITLALAQMLFYLFNDQQYWGGTDGMNIDRRPTLALGELTLLNFGNRVQFYYLALACLAGAFALLAVLLRSPFGHALVGIRANEGRMRALGYDVQRVKLIAFVIAGTLAGLAGFLEAARSTFATPALLGWHESGHVLVLVILGGMGTLYGPVLGAFVVLLLEDYFATLTDRWLLIMGVFVIAVVMFLPDGLAGLGRRVAALARGRGRGRSAGDG
ncbi:MAG: branched-chain amino acid ABC transporter permease [Alphaproteobacteria bacterium]|nr:branched-chain amino acid ABC transporter permease [Alphaproteobacteria bacterium]